MYKTRRKTSYILLYLEEWEYDAGLEDIEAVQRSKGALSCGYHYVVRKDGKVETARPDDVYGWHDHHRNADSVAVAIVVDPGSKPPEDNPANALFEALQVKYPHAEIKETFE